LRHYQNIIKTSGARVGNLYFISKYWCFSLEEAECKASSKEVPSIPHDVKDIDEDMSDPFLVSEYAYEIFQNMKAREVSLV